jgi:membrane protein YdbS with pleckstrin-like domain
VRPWSTGPTRAAPEVDPVRRLLFWLRVPFVADAALVVVGVCLLVAGDGVGWWVLVFAGLRAVVGVVAIAWIAPRMIARLSAAERPPGAAEPPAPPVDRVDP